MPTGIQTTNEDWDAAWASTARAVTKEVFDNISDTYPFVKMLRSAKKFDVTEVVAGGKQFQFNLMYELATGQWFDEYAELNNTAIDGISAGFVTPRYLQVPLVINAIEEAQNQGAHKVFDLLKAKQTQVSQGILSTLNAAAWGAQSGSSILGMQDWVADAPTNTIAGIDRGTYTWFKNQVNGSGGNFNSASGDFYAGYESMGAMMALAGDANDKPDMIGSTTTLTNEFQTIHESKGYSRVVAGDRAKVGSENPIFRGAEIFDDRDCPANRMYFINTKYLGMKIHRGFNLNKTPFQRGERQLARFSRMVFGGNMVCTNPRRLGVITFT